jgi:hypothetical protein
MSLSGIMSIKRRKFSEKCAIMVRSGSMHLSKTFLEIEAVSRYLTSVMENCEW